MPCTTLLPTGDPTPSATSVPTLDIAPLFVTTPSGDITLAGPHTAAQARNPHRGRTTILRRRLWQHSVSGRHSILEVRLRGTTTNTACLPGQRRSWGTDVTMRQCRARNLRHIMRYQLALLCPDFDPLPRPGQLRRRRPRRGKRRAHRPKHRPSVPTQLRLRSDYIPTTTHYTSPQPCLQATYTRPTETVITTYKVSNMRAIPNCSRPPPVGRYLSSRQLSRLASGQVLDEYCYATIAMDEPVDRPIHRLTHRQRKRILRMSVFIHEESMSSVLFDGYTSNTVVFGN